MPTPDQQRLCAWRAENLAKLLDGDYPEILIGNMWALLYEAMVNAYGPDVLERSQLRMDRISDEIKGEN